MNTAPVRLFVALIFAVVLSISATSGFGDIGRSLKENLFFYCVWSAIIIGVIGLLMTRLIKRKYAPLWWCGLSLMALSALGILATIFKLAGRSDL